MKSEKMKGRSVLVEAVDKQVIPLLQARGFRDLEKPRESIPMWHLHRSRSDGGYDAISIIFDKKRRPLFDAVINVIGARIRGQILWSVVVKQGAGGKACTLGQCFGKKVDG